MQNVSYKEEKRAPSEYNGKTTYKMKLVPVEDTRKNFIDKVLPEVEEFRCHIERVKYKELQNLKRNLPRDHAICQMDFAQNYICSHADEIQSAYLQNRRSHYNLWLFITVMVSMAS